MSRRPVHVTAHAIDQASLRLLDAWRSDRAEDEGLHSWLAARAWSARVVEPVRDDGRATAHIMDGIEYVFRGDVLLTVKQAGELRQRPFRRLLGIIRGGKS